MAEAHPFIEGMRLEQAAERPFRTYRGGVYTLIVSGIGKVNAALASAALIREHNAQCVFNAGSAGALSPFLKLGDIRHISAVYEYDRRPQKGLPRRTGIMPGHAEAVLATADVPALSAEERQAAGRFADLADMEGAAVVRACGKYGIKAFLFKAVSDTSDTAAGDIIGNIEKVSLELFQYFEEKVMPHV
jgi:nucleoside phosphorylase